MIVIVALLAHALLLGGPAARALAHSRWAARSPQNALRCWHTCAFGMIVSIVTALVLVAHDLWEHGMVWLFHADKPRIHAAYGGTWMAQGIADVALLLLLLGAAALSGLTLHRTLRLNRLRRRYRQTADSHGEQEPGGDPAVRIVVHREPAAFCIPGGRGGSRIVVTTGARSVLTKVQLAATVEHERAHLRLRHHRSVLVADVLTTALGWCGLLRYYADQVRRLAEMAADDQAAARHGRRAVASALLEMGSSPAKAVRPEDFPSMSGPDPAERIRRLIACPPSPPRMLAIALWLSAATAALLPVALACAPAVLLADTAVHVAATDAEPIAAHSTLR